MRGDKTAKWIKRVCVYMYIYITNVHIALKRTRKKYREENSLDQNLSSLVIKKIIEQ